MITLDSAHVPTITEDHVYYFRGNRWPGVTEVLASHGFFGGYPVGGDYMLRGRYVHSACQFLDNGTLDESSLNYRIRGYVSAYKRLLFNTGADIIAAETRMAHPIRGYCGTPDRFVINNGEVEVWDLKTGNVIPGVRLQLSAYAMLAAFHPDLMMLCHGPIRRVAVELHDDGTYRFNAYEIHDNQRDEAAWVAALNLYHWKRIVGVKDVNHDQGNDGL